ncbi:translation initiation factor eIF2B delta subunit [Mucor lusitanicus]
MTTPNLSTSAVNSPLIGQPMVSYETQWLGTPTTASSSIEDRLRRRSSQGGNNPEDARGRSQSSAKKPSTKAERRALQEKQRAEKQKRVSTANTSTNPPNNADKKPPVNNPTRPKNAALAAKNDQQRKSILNHLELPKKPDTDKTKTCIQWCFIKDHQPPEDATFVRHIQKHLDPHIAFLLKYRYMSLSIRECIRWLKKVMADLVAIHPPVADEDARQMLQNQIARFIRERITMADELIAHNALTKIENGDVVLTFAKSSVVERIFLEAKKAGRDFQVIVVDSRPLLEGKNLCVKLVRNGIKCKYTLISGIYDALKAVTKVFLGSHAILNNGSSYARIGSAAVAMAATDKQIPVILCCETYKFVNRTQVDSLVMNEKGDPYSLVQTSDTAAPILANWKQQQNLSILNLMYDVTPSKYISAVVTEIGIIPCTSAPVIWREYNQYANY